MPALLEIVKKLLGSGFYFTPAVILDGCAMWRADVSEWSGRGIKNKLKARGHRWF